MRKKDRDKPIGKLRVVEDFLPSPLELFPDKNLKKVTIALDEQTIAFFKKAATRSHQKYQRMIRLVLRKYAEKYKEKTS